MMIIQNGDKTLQGSWHVGECMRVPEDAVLHFTVDCDEQQWLLNVIHDALLKERLYLKYPAKNLTPIY